MSFFHHASAEGFADASCMVGDVIGLTKKKSITDQFQARAARSLRMVKIQLQKSVITCAMKLGMILWNVLPLQIV